MIYLIKFFFFLTISHYSFANENRTNEILFKINNKVFTNIDLEERKEYVSIINNIRQSEFTETNESLQIFDEMAQAGGPSKPNGIGQNLFNVYNI